MECLGSCLTNKYSEGQAGKRYYGGNEVIDKIEWLCKKRALSAFNLKDDEWHVNVQPYSGSPANFAAYTAVLQPHDRIMGFKMVRERAQLFRPKMIIADASAYPRTIDWKLFREIADEVGALFMVDMAHISGLVAAGVHPSPFEYADIVTTTTHKSLQGPRAGMIFAKMNGKVENIAQKIDEAVFPALQGGPHNHQIGALAVQLKAVNSQDFKDYAKQVVANSQSLAKELQKLGHKLSADGTDNHLVLWDVRPLGLTGGKSALSPGGVRVGTPAMTTRGMKEADFVVV